MNINQRVGWFCIQLSRTNLLIYIDSTLSINKGKCKKVRIVIPVVVGSSPISHPKFKTQTALTGRLSFEPRFGSWTRPSGL